VSTRRYHREPPSCVLGNFPHTFAHAARWARDVFRAMFEEAPRRTNAYLREPGYVADTINAPVGTRGGKGTREV